MSLNFIKLNAFIVGTLLLGSALAAEPQEHHRHDFAKDVDAFHSVLAPLWHMPAGEERLRKVCASAKKLESLSKEIRSGDNQALLRAATALKTQCQSGSGGIDAALSALHDAFHHFAAGKSH